jgi:hypothetical protein
MTCAGTRVSCKWPAVRAATADASRAGGAAGGGGGGTGAPATGPSASAPRGRKMEATVNGAELTELPELTARSTLGRFFDGVSGAYHI